MRNGKHASLLVLSSIFSYRISTFEQSLWKLKVALSTISSQKFIKRQQLMNQQRYPFSQMIKYMSRNCKLLCFYSFQCVSKVTMSCFSYSCKDNNKNSFYLQIIENYQLNVFTCVIRKYSWVERERESNGYDRSEQEVC